MAVQTSDISGWVRRIRLRHLEILLTISQAGSLTAAAHALHITQPAASQWLADIEAIAGVPLFVRGRRLRPTAYAAPLLRHAERVLGDAERVFKEVAAVRDGGGGLVRIGAMLVASVDILPHSVIELHKQQPTLRIELVEDAAVGLWARFERNELDLLIARLDERALSSGYPHEKLFSDRYCVVAGPQHPLAGKAHPTWHDAEKFPWLMPLQGSPLRMAIETTFAKEGCNLPEVWLDTASVTASQVLLIHTECLGVLSGTAARHNEKAGLLRALPLELTSELGQVHDVGMIWKEAKPEPALAAVLSILRQKAQQPSAAPRRKRRATN
jgi:DNA-binding transcriptional LysR family regulator